MSPTATSAVGRWRLFAIMVVIVVIINFPIIVIVANSFQTTEQIMMSRSVIPQHFSLANYQFLWSQTSFLRFLLNSVIVSGGSMLCGIVAASMAGYALSRFKGPVLSIYSKALFVIQMFPIILALIPLFMVFRALELVNSPIPVIIIYTVVHLPFATWMAKAFFDTIPRELEEAALVDGCSKFQAFIRIVLPLSGPGMAAVSIFSFLFSYNEFFVGSVFLRDESAMTVPIGMQMFMQQFATDWGSLMAAATLAVIPTFILFLMVQKYITYGAVAGGVKG
ncbi:carbohydrate ABC transporter permease [Rhizobium sp. P38BS-XIX]|uniref:carbohydrate ABC transporter permease n=1 Tax=Rhizobium sp. P38BS-XIX TaxID=2726740 RepID=UPI0014574646|nr:carbohydrate ABC transporter permease [Rhizobium sp. P38BS-XIX]NLS01720.1 carbohydrate ABC transporter permease [Rhizobium sp. P38BS-XIX]